MSEVAVLKKIVCQELRSCLSFYIAQGLTISKLNKFYWDLNGKSIPFSELGFSNLISFLQSIPDVVHVRSGFPEPQIFLVSDEKTKHIEKLQAVTAIKSNNRAKRGRSSLRYPNSSRRQYYPYEDVSKAISKVTQGCVPIIVRGKLDSLLKEFGATGTPIENIQSHYQKKNGAMINFEYFGFPSLQKCLSSIPTIVTLKADYRNNIFCISTEEMKKALENEYLKRIASNAQNERFTKSPNVQFNDQVVTIPKTTQHPPSQQTIVESSSEGENFSDKLKRRMRKVLAIHPNGLCIDTFLDEYEKINNEVLNLEDIGYYDITELVDQNQNIFGIFRTDDAKKSEIIYDVRSRTPDFSSYTSVTTKDIPKDVISNIKSILESDSRELSEREFEESYKINCQSELKWRDFGFSTKEDFYKKLSEYIALVITISHGEMHLKLKHQKSKYVPSSTILCEREHIPRPITKIYKPEDAATCKDNYIQQKIPSYKDLDDFIEVVVSDVKNPGCFYIQLIGLQYADALEKLMDNLEKFYQSYPRCQSYKIPHQEFKVHLPCAALYEKDWHRAIIVGLPPLNEAVEVFYIDYGTNARVARDDVCFIPKKFMDLPFQAIKCRLGLVEPFNLHGWTDTSGERLLQLTRGRDLLCKFLHTRGLDYKKGLEVVVTDTNSEDDIQINDIMIQEGHARKCEDNINLINNFEREDTPSFGSSTSSLTAELERVPIQMLPESVKLANQSYPRVPESGLRPPVLKSTPSGFVKGQKRLNMDILHKLLELKRNEAPKCTDINNFDFSIFSGVPSTPCPNILSMPQSSNVSRTSTPTPICNTTPHILNSIRGEATQNLIEFGNSPTLSPQHIYAATLSSSKNIDIPNTTTNQLQSTPLAFPQPSRVNELTGLMDTNSQKRYAKQITFLTGYSGHIINYKKKGYLTSFDLSTFIFASNNLILNMFRRLKIKVDKISIEDKECPDLFTELKKIHARGFEGGSEEKSLTLFPLTSCIESLQEYPNKELENAIQQSVDSFDPEDSYWLESEDDYANLTPELLQERIDQLITERKTLLTLLQISDPRDTKNHLAYADLMNDLFYAIEIQKIMIKEKSQSDVATSVNRTMAALNINSPPKPAKNVQAVAPMVSNQTTLPTSSSGIQTTSATSSALRITLAANTISLPTQSTTTTSSMQQANPMTNFNQTTSSIVSGPPLMMPMLSNMGFPGMAHNNMGYPIAMNCNLPYQQCFLPSPQFRPLYHQFPIYNSMDNSNVNSHK